MARTGDEIPTSKARRATSTTAALGPSSARLAATLLASVARDPEKARQMLEERHLDLADRTVKTLGNLRGGAMKLGQLASFVDVEFLPAEYREIYQEKLAELRDAAPAMSWEKVRGVLEREWEMPVDEVFESISPDAAAAASIGQIHRGVLKDGREVAVKVQYPEIADALESDLDLASVAIGFAKAIAPGLDPRVVAAELRERVLEELDFELEAQQQRTFARAYRGHPFVYVPEVMTSLARRRVLVTEWVNGHRFDVARSYEQERRDELGEIIVRFFFGSMGRLGRFNTDPHPGNYLVLDDGRIAFLDFGNTAEVGDRARMKVALSAAMHGDAAGLTSAASELGYVRSERRIDQELLLQQARTLGDWYLHDRELRIDPDYVAAVIASLVDPRAMEGAFRLVRQLKLPPEEIWLRRVETSVLAVLGQLRATRNWHRIMREIVFGDAPATELGRQETAFWSRRERRA